MLQYSTLQCTTVDLTSAMCVSWIAVAQCNVLGTALFCIVLHCTVLYCTVVYCTALPLPILMLLLIASIILWTLSLSSSYSLYCLRFSIYLFLVSHTCPSLAPPYCAPVSPPSSFLFFSLRPAPSLISSSPLTSFASPPPPSFSPHHFPPLPPSSPPSSRPPFLFPPHPLPPPIVVSTVIPILYLFLCLIGDSEASNPSSLSRAGRLAVTSLVNLSAALESTVHGRHGQHGQGDLSKLLCSRVDVCLSMLLQRSPSARSYLFSEMQGGDDTVQNAVLNRSRSAEVWNFSVFWSKICLFKAYFNTHTIVLQTAFYQIIHLIPICPSISSSLPALFHRH